MKKSKPLTEGGPSKPAPSGDLKALMVIQHDKHLIQPGETFDPKKIGMTETECAGLIQRGVCRELVNEE